MEENKKHEKEHIHEHHDKIVYHEKNQYSKLLLAVTGFVILLVLFNQWQIAAMDTMVNNMQGIATADVNSGIQTSSQKTPMLTGDAVNDAIAIAIPTGVPDIYGKELGVSFDTPVESMAMLESIDRGNRKITLTGNDLQRYVKIASMTACEYCCGATTLVFKDGRAACGCAHSAAMRGLIAYMIQNHPDTSDDKILEEANRWKALFFPKESVKKVLDAQAKSGKLDANVLNQLPQMVGGC